MRASVITRSAMGHINGPQQRCLEDTEDDDVSGDAQGQDQDCSDSEARGTAHLAQGEA